MTIDQTVSWIGWSLLLTAIVLGWVAARRVWRAGRLRYYLLRREQAASGWRLLLGGAVFGMAAVVVLALGRSAAYVVFPPTPSITPTSTRSPTPTITLTPKATVTPSISPTPSITATPTSTSTPVLPETLLLAFQDTVTPRPEAVLSPILVAQRLTNFNIPIRPAEVFDNPVGRLFGAFSYDHLDNGVRWSALWYLDGDPVCFETKPWDGGTGGYGYTDCLPEGGWAEGRYEIQIFIGTTWQVSTVFEIRGDPPTATATATTTMVSSPTP
jgi:hypothetical protein